MSSALQNPRSAFPFLYQAPLDEDESLVEDDCPDNAPVYEGWLETYIQLLERDARTYIERFFADKTWHCGGPIPLNQLYSEQSVHIVMSTEFGEGIDICYKVLKQCPPPSDFDHRLINWDTYCMINLITEIRSYGIPKPLQSGMMLLYLKFCKGYRVPEKNLNIAHIIE